MSRWMLRQSSADLDNLTRQTGLSPVLARLLAVRGYGEPEQIAAFLSPGETADPLLFADMERAVDVAAQAIADEKKIAIFGDYDADGVMSTLILYTSLRYFGGDAIYYIPDREGEGYGLNTDALATLRDRGIEVVFACDTGISGFEQIKYGNSIGLTMVVLDHHAVTVDEGGKEILPPAAAVVDARRSDCAYPFKEYCAAGVCYCFSRALSQRLGSQWSLLEPRLLPLATIATICDLVELTGENRSLVQRGLPALTAYKNTGFQALVQAVGLGGRSLDAYHVGFILGPCINASGRLDIADIAVELFLCAEADQAQDMAQRLVELNRQRRRLTEEGTDQVISLIEEQGLAEDKVIVLHCPQAEGSVVGVIAGRVKERYYRPTLILAGEGPLVRGSGRSIEGYNIYQALFSCRDLLQAFGGHPMAAGVSVELENIPLLRQRLNAECALSQEELQPLYRIDMPLTPSRADLSLARDLTRLAPYGKGNPQPLFATKRLRLTRLALLGREEQVLRWYLRQGDGAPLEVLDFNGRRRLESFLREKYGERMWAELLNGAPSREICLDIIFHLSVNHYNGRDSAQLQLVDFRGAE